MSLVSRLFRNAHCLFGWLPMELQGDTQDDYLRMAESMAIDWMYRFCGQLWRCLERPICAHPMRQTHLGYWHKMQKGFPGALGMEEMSICA